MLDRGGNLCKPHWDLRLEVCLAVKIQVSVFWVVVVCSGMVGYQGEDVNSMVLQNIGIPPHLYSVTAHWHYLNLFTPNTSF
jgi:hypothetical protein